VIYHLPSDIKYSKAKLIIGNYSMSVKKNIDVIYLRPYEACVYQLI